MRYITLALLSSLMAGCGGVEVAPLEEAVGEPMGVFPSPEERLMLNDSARLLRDPVVAAICTIEVSTGLVFAFFTAFIVVAAIRLGPDADLAKLVLGLLPKIGRFVGKLQPKLGRQRRRDEARMSEDESGPIENRRAHAFQCNAQTSVNRRRAVALSTSTLSASLCAMRLAPSLWSAPRLRSIASICAGLAVRMAA